MSCKALRPGATRTFAFRFLTPAAMHDPGRLLNFPSLLNARDLGGYPTLDGSHKRWRSLVRAMIWRSYAGRDARSRRFTASRRSWTCAGRGGRASPSPVARDLQQVH